MGRRKKTMTKIDDDWDAFRHDMRTGTIDANKTYHIYMGGGVWISSTGSKILKSLEEIDKIFEGRDGE